MANGFSSGQSVFLALVNALGYGLQGSKVGAVRCWEHLDVIREGGGRLSCGGPFVRSQYLIDFPRRLGRGRRVILTGWDVPHFATMAKRRPRPNSAAAADYFLVVLCRNAARPLCRPSYATPSHGDCAGKCGRSRSGGEIR